MRTVGWNERKRGARSREKERERFETILKQERYLRRESGCFGG